MKKIVKFLIVFVFCVVATGCFMKSSKNESAMNGDIEQADKWRIESRYKVSEMSDEALNVFKKANTKYEVVALLGKQVVAGMNYMYLVYDGDNYRVVVVYNDLNGNASLTHNTVFDFTEYANKDASNPAQELVGGWTVDIPENGVKLESYIQTAFDKAMENLVGMNYTPIGTVGYKYGGDGTTYLVLSYGSMVTAEPNSGIYLLTLYDDSKGNPEIKSSAYVDLANYNK